MPGPSFRIGRIAGIPYVLAAGGVMLWAAGDVRGMWIAVFGMVLTTAARAERSQKRRRSALIGLRVGDLMSRDAIALPLDLPARVAAGYFYEFRHDAFPVTDPVGWPVGLLRLEALEHVTDEQRYGARVAELADTDPGLVAAEDDDVASLFDRPAFRRVGRAAVVGPGGQLVGIVSTSDLKCALRARRLSAQAARPRGLGRDR